MIKKKLVIQSFYIALFKDESNQKLYLDFINEKF